ncbi:PKD domain-containing protein [Candidatus Woesearchaeota archaeon]|nr:PKD domain-containing protein [Candidatus Woesearchaeota archaeon]
MKRGLFIVLFIVLLSNFVFANVFVDTNLTRTKYGPDNTFDGYFKFNFSGNIPSNSEVIFYNGDSDNKVTLKQLFQAADLYKGNNIVPATFGPVGNSNGILEFNSSGGSKIEVGVDLSGNGFSSGDVDVTNFTFDVEAIGRNVRDLAIYLGEKKIYEYRGGETGFIDLSNKHITDSGTEGTQGITGNSVLCQLINVNSSGKYKVKVFAQKKVSDPNVGLNATISEEVLGDSDQACQEETPCCTLNGLSNSMREVDCDIIKNIPEDKPLYFCVYPTNANEDSTDYFDIKTKATQPKNSFFNGAENQFNRNFYIFGQYMTYNKALNVGPSNIKQVEIKKEDIDNYMSDSGSLVMPLNFTVGSGGDVKITNLFFRYLVGGSSATERQFKKINHVPEALKYDRLVNINLESLNTVLTPKEKDNDYEFYVEFNGSRTNKTKFEVVDAPVAFFTIDPFKPGKGELVTFDASASTAPLGRNIINYTWDFGDGKTGNGPVVTYTYTKIGVYEIKLKVKDSEGLIDVDKVFIEIGNDSSGSGNIINTTLSSLSLFKDNLRKGNEKVKDTADLIGLNSKLNNFEANLTDIKNKFDRINNNATLTDQQKNGLIAPLLSQAGFISSKIPISFNVDSSNFNDGGKINGLNQIKSCCEFTTELQRTKLLTAQKNVNVNFEARVVNLQYIDGSKEEYTVIKKIINGDGNKIYEFLPFGFSIGNDDVFKGGNITNAASGVYSFAYSNEIAYKLDTTDLNKALQARTAVLPADLESVEVDKSTTKNGEVEILSECGNNFCEEDEDELSCPKDCKKGNTFLFILIGVAVIVIGIIIYFGLFFKGGFLNKKFGKVVSSVSGSFGGGLFKTERDHQSLKMFVQNSLNKGLNEGKIKIALKSKGWRDNQIDSVIREIKSPRKIGPRMGFRR